MEQTLDSNNVWNSALIDNTAQGIFNELEKLVTLGSIHQRRWIWELCQNALDSANGKVTIEIELTTNSVIFRHDGYPFKEIEIAHLVYHGSTKREQSGKLGKFGTGFLTTHLLSKITTVNGILDDNRTFSFVLDRSGKTIDAIRESMEKSKIQFEESKTSGKAIKPIDPFTTEYIYKLDANGLKVAQTGIEDLREIAAYVIALNNEIKCVKLTINDTKEEFTKVPTESLTDGIQIIEIKHEINSNPDSRIYVSIARDGNISVGLKLTKIEDIFYISDNSSLSRLFLAFPLFGTNDFSFPAVINNRDFIPLPDRDGIYLQKDNEDANTQNKLNVRRAIPLLVKLTDQALNQKWSNIQFLAKASVPPSKSWLDVDWYNGILKDLIITNYMELKLVESSSNWIKPKNAYFPIPSDPDVLWEIASYIYRDKLPLKNMSSQWEDIIRGWSGLLGKKVEDLDQVLTIEKLAQKISEFGNLEQLEKNILKSEIGEPIINPVQLLNNLFSYILSISRTQIFDAVGLLPNQNGIFQLRKNLKSDSGIDENLKDIAKEIGIDIRDSLLNSNISQPVNKLLISMTQDELLNQLLKTVKEKAKSNPNDEHFEKANLNLFEWLTNKKQYELLKEYPVYSRQTNDKNKESIAYLGCKEGILAPIERWSGQGRDFVQLFPQEFIISSKYTIPKEAWDALQTQNLVMCEPIYFSQRTINDTELRSSVSLEEILDENEHGIKNINMSDIAFLRDRNIGIIARLRNSKPRARLFIKFLMYFAVDFDRNSLEPKEFVCSNCDKKHKIYSSYWLTTLKTTLWVPVGRNQELPTSKNLAELFRDQPDILNKMDEDKSSKLLNILNASITDIMKFIVGKDEKTKLELDRATGKLYRKFSQNPQQLTGLAKLVEEEPDFVQEFQKKIEQRAKIRRNQEIGATVERIFKSLFDDEALKKEGFSIKRTPIGCDYTVEYDFIENEMEQLLEVKKGNNTVMIELKSTVENYVKMTSTQGKKAVDNQNNYALCVVTLNSDKIDETVIRQNCMFALNIGEKLVDKVDKLNEFETKSNELASIGGEVAIELDEGQVHFKISKPIWEIGKTFDQFLDFIRKKL